MRNKEGDRKRFTFAHEQRESIVEKQEDLTYFESLVNKYDEDLSVPLKIKLQSIQNDDAIIELQEVYGEVERLEQNFKKALEVCNFMLEKNKDLYSYGESIENDYFNLR